MVNVVTPTNLGSEFIIGTAVPNKITIINATQTDEGKVRFATPTEVAAPANNVAVTPQDLANAIAAIPGAVPDVVGPTPPSPGAVGQRWYNNSGSTVSGVPTACWSTYDGAAWKVDTNVAAANLVVASTTPPASPVIGDRWYNASGATSSGVPAASWATYDGAAWKVDTNGAAGNVVVSSATPPVSPVVGDRWYNASGATASGVPSASWATYDGAAWKVDTNGASGNTVVVSATAPASPIAGDRWYNSSGATASGVPSACWATWDGAAWKVDTNVTSGSTSVSSATAPASPNVGDRWYNSSGAVVSGVPAACWATWDGAAWKVDTNVPSGSVSSGATAPASPNLGDRWLNTSGGALSGVESGAWGTWNGANWLQDTEQSSSVVTQIFTASGTWTKPAGLKSAEAIVTGGGGGGAGTVGGAGQHSGGTGGNAGATAIVHLDASALPATVPVTVGAAGTAGAAAAAGNGGTGGNSAFDTFATAGGGVGGTRVAPNTTPVFTPSSTTAAIAVAPGGLELGGGNGEPYIRMSGTAGGGGRGAPSYWGGGGRGAPGGIGNDGGAYGAGGGGAGSPSTAAFAGGAGGAGVVVIKMYF